jgi:hypothetical protein
LNLIFLLRRVVEVVGWIVLVAAVITLIGGFAERVVPGVPEANDSSNDLDLWPPPPQDERTPQPVLTLIAHRLVPNEARFDVLFRLAVPAAVLQRIWDTERKQYVMGYRDPTLTTSGSTGACVLGKDYRQQQLLVRAAGIGSVEMPLSDLAESSGTLETEIEGSKTLGLPVRSQPELYPSDWYLLATDLRITLPPGLTLVPEIGGCVDGPLRNPSPGIDDLPFRLRGIKEAGMDGLTIQQTSASEAPVGTSDIHNVSLLVTRDTQRVWYLKVISWTPAFVGVAFIITLIMISRLPRRSRREPQLTLVVSMSAVMLAVLPLRTVLVPAELPFFTRTDAELSMATALIAFGLLLAAVLLWLDLIGVRVPKEGDRQIQMGAPDA